MMKTPLLVGTLLLVVGVASFAYQGLHEETPEPRLEGAAETDGSPPLSPVLGGTALVAGTVLVIIGKRKPPVT